MPINMSYCKFENTVAALKECWDNWDEHEPEELSEYEREAQARLIKLCKQIADNYAEGTEDA